MRKKGFAWLLVLVLCLGTVLPAAAANTFTFAEKKISLFEGDTFQAELIREGSFADGGEVTFSSSKESIVSVSDDGTVTALKKGEAVVTASLTKNGKRTGKAQMTVKVLRAVTKVTLNTAKLSVYDPEDPAVFEYLNEETENQVLVIPAGSAVSLSTTCTPEDASGKKVTYTSTDVGVAKVTGFSLKALQRGECDLTIASEQNPEVTETFHVLVIQPVKKIEIQAGGKKVAAGSSMELTAVCSPDNATIKDVIWSSANPAIIEVDANGTVTGRKRGSANIVATAADGSGVKTSVYMNVTQPVTSISFAQRDYTVVTGRSVQARGTVLPADASDKTVTWTSSDESVARVKGGQITGVKAGECTVTCTSKSNPEVSADVAVTVIQLATKIECANPQSELSIKTGEQVETRWNVLPADTTDTGLTFRSLHPRVATVDENGVVTAVSRGTATIVATSTDQGKRNGSVRITVIQPVTGVEMQSPLYYVQNGTSSSVRAIVQPRNANNQKVHWSSADEYIATVRSNGTSTGSVHGVTNGYTTVTASTDDGGFTASARIRVGNFNDAVMVEELYVNNNNEIKISMRNMSQDLVLENIHFVVEVYDMHGYPLVCQTDGESTTFEGDYPYTLNPLERTVHGSFRFRHYNVEEEIGAIVLTVVSWRDSEGVTWKIPESERVLTPWARIAYYPIQDVG